MDDEASSGPDQAGDGAGMLDLSQALIVDQYQTVAGSVSGETSEGEEGNIDALVIAIAASDDDGNQFQHRYVMPLKAGMDLSLHISQAIASYLAEGSTRADDGSAGTDDGATAGPDGGSGPTGPLGADQAGSGPG